MKSRLTLTSFDVLTFEPTPSTVPGPDGAKVPLPVVAPVEPHVQRPPPLVDRPVDAASRSTPSPGNG